MSGPGKFSRVESNWKPQVPLLVCPSVNSFKFQPCDRTPPGTQTLLISRRVQEGLRVLPLPIPGRYRLRLGLLRCLIVFDPLTFVLDQWVDP